MTNIRQSLSAAADRLFTSFASVTAAATYHRMGSTYYNAATGNVASGNTDIPCKVVLEDWKQSEINGETVKVGDRKALVRGKQLGLEPSSDDNITIGAQFWHIVDYAADPAGIVFTLHIRSTQ